MKFIKYMELIMFFLHLFNHLIIKILIHNLILLHFKTFIFILVKLS